MRRPAAPPPSGRPVGGRRAAAKRGRPGVAGSPPMRPPGRFPAPAPGAHRRRIPKPCPRPSPPCAHGGARTRALGERGGLAGYLVELAGGDAYALYLTPDGHAVAGLLYAPDGTLLTGGQLAAVRPASGRSAVETLFRHSGGRTARSGTDAPIHTAHAAGPDAEALFERSAAAFGFTLGRTGPLAVLFGDPACRWSRSAAARLGERALAGRLRLRVVPVGLLGAASARTAAGIASSPDPATAWFGGDVPPPQPEGGTRIARNNALYEAWGETGVPLIVRRGARGRIAHRVGDIDDVDAWLGGLPHE